MTTHNWKSILNTIQQHQEVSRGDLLWAMDEIMTGQTSEPVIAAFLMGLHTKGESIDELAALAEGMVSKARPINISRAAVDIVGTGGDQHNTVNISTMSAVVAAGAGIPVIKHGNRASSSMSGTADVLEALGINLNKGAEEIESIFQETGIAFLFAQTFHPSMKYVAPVRKQLSVPTPFNYLGPLTNPAHVNHSAIGVANPRMAQKIAGVFSKRPKQQALIFRGDDGLDEITVTTTSFIWEVEEGQVTQHIFDPRDYGFTLGSLEDLRGGNAHDNAQIFREVLSGKERGPIRDAVIINAAAGIMAYTASRNLSFEQRFATAIAQAHKSIDSTKAQRKLEAWIKAEE